MGNLLDKAAPKTRPAQHRHHYYEKRCEYCHKPYFPASRKQRFCGKKCRNDWMRHYKVNPQRKKLGMLQKTWRKNRVAILIDEWKQAAHFINTTIERLEDWNQIERGAKGLGYRSDTAKRKAIKIIKSIGK
jgi:hypothetical protein